MSPEGGVTFTAQDGSITVMMRLHVLVQGGLVPIRVTVAVYVVVPEGAVTVMHEVVCPPGLQAYV